MEHRYTPIACSAYDVLEAAATRGVPLLLDLKEEGTSRTRKVRITDLFSRDRQEFLRAVDLPSGEECTVRLDAIRRITDPQTETVYIPDSCCDRP